MMSKLSTKLFLLALPIACFSAGQNRTLFRDSAQAAAWAGKTLPELAAQAQGLKFVGSGAATASGNWNNEIWVIGKAMRKPGVPFQYLVLTHPPRSQEQKSSVVSDVLVFAGQKGADLFVHECHAADKLMPVAAIVQVNNGGMGRVIQAWTADTIVGTLLPVDPKSVKCSSEQETAE